MLCDILIFINHCDNVNSQYKTAAYYNKTTVFDSEFRYKNEYTSLRDDNFRILGEAAYLN